jgi:hypothetical protein
MRRWAAMNLRGSLHDRRSAAYSETEIMVNSV